MTDALIEKVAKLICETDNVDGFKCTCPVPYEPDWCNGNRAKAQARAAIKAVAEHLLKTTEYCDWRAAEKLLRHLDVARDEVSRG